MQRCKRQLHTQHQNTSPILYLSVRHGIRQHPCHLPYDILVRFLSVRHGVQRPPCHLLSTHSRHATVRMLLHILSLFEVSTDQLTKAVSPYLESVGISLTCCDITSWLVPQSKPVDAAHTTTHQEQENMPQSAPECTVPSIPTNHCPNEHASPSPW